MKTSQDPRHKKRIELMQDLFTWEFQRQPDCLRSETAKVIVSSLSEIDQAVVQAAPAWPINQINRIDLAILRLAIFELIIKKDAPFKVIVDEAIELAKEFGAESSPSFINGVLGQIIETNSLDKEKGE